MKLKYVLLSGLFMSVGFAACTNDDFTEAVAPVNTEDAISLGEGYTITVAKGNADTRAYMEDLQTAVWEETDTLGAAWYDKITKAAINPSSGKLEITHEATKNGSDAVYETVRQFKWDSWAGDDKTSAVFKTGEDINAGAYMLYYPYSKGELNETAGSLEVNLPAEQDMDCTTGNELKGVSKSIFAYAPVAFLEGGAQATEEFNLNQLTNVLALQFKIEDSKLLGLLNKVSIAKVIISAKDANGDALASKGEIAVPTVSTTATETVDTYLANNFDGKDLFSVEETADQIILNVTGASDDYAITKLGKDGMTKAFYISMLPAEADLTEFTVRILTDNDVVLAKTYKNTSDAEGKKIVDALNKQVKEQGQLIKLNVTLEDLNDTEEIYVESQFKSQWEAALKSTEASKLNVAAELDLSDYELDINAAAGDITITGKPVTVKSLTSDANTKLIIDNNMTVKGNVSVGPKAGAISTGNAGELNVEGKMEVNGTTGALTIGSIAELETAISGQITLKGVDNTSLAAITDAEEYPMLGKVTNNGDLTLNENILLITELTNSKDGELIVNGTLYNYGKLIQNGEMTTPDVGALNNTKGATATFTKATGGQGTALNILNAKGATINVEIEGNYNSNTNKNDNGARFAVNATNKGTINVKKGYLTTDSGKEFKMDDASARVYVEKNALIWLTNETGITAAGKTVQLNWFAYLNANQTINGTLTTICNTWVNGNVALSGKGTFSVAGEAHLYIPGNNKLLVGKDVTVEIAKMSSKEEVLKIDAENPSKVTVKTIE